MIKFSALSLSVFSLILAAPTWAQTRNYSVESRDAPVGDLLRLLARMQDKNLLVPSGLEGNITLSFPSVTLNDAMNAILESKGLGTVSRNNIVQVLPKKEMEAQGQDLQIKTFHLKYAKARELREQALGLISTRGSVMTDERINALTIKDTAAYIQNVSSLIEIVDQIDRQVLIEARMVEATTDFSRSVGIQWGISSKTGILKFDGVAAGVPGSPSSGFIGTAAGAAAGAAGAAAAPALPTNLGGTNFIQATPAGNPVAALALGLGPFGTTSLDIQLSAAEQEGKVSVLSRPTVVTTNNKPASIRSGLKFYVKAPGNISIGSSSGSVGAGSSNLQQISAGLSMTVTPQITIDDKISLTIEVTASQPDFSKSVDGIPTVSDNTATTTVLLEDGQTTIIGGMFQLQDSVTDKGLPFLHRIPILGKLFGSSNESKVKKELLIFIRPNIVREAIKELFKDQEPAKETTTSSL